MGDNWIEISAKNGDHITGKIKAEDTYLSAFPYLATPIPGSPNGVNGVALN